MSDSPAVISLFPFKVDLQLDTGSESSLPRVDVLGMTSIVEDWLAVSFASNSLGDEYAQFQSILLDYQENRNLRRQLQNTAVFTARFEGAAVWDTAGNVSVPTEADVLSLQLEALVERERLLLEQLQLSDADGLGDSVLALEASLDQGGGNVGQQDGNSDDGLDVVIIVAIVIAGLAFVLLVFALYMAWRYRNAIGGSASMQDSLKRVPNGATRSESDFETGASPSKRQSRAVLEATAAPPSEIDPSEAGGGVYPESLISEDISTSLTAYYRSGMGIGPLTRDRNASGGLNDAASVSSMESYNYSLDGYASSMIGNTKDDDPY